MSCATQISKKYAQRPSPPIKANDCKGKTKKGNDGSMYVSKPNVNGVYRWSRKSSKSTTARVKKSTTRAKKECKPDQIRNPLTGRCKKVSKSTTRATRVRATATRAQKPCRPDQERNPITGRCRKIANSVLNLFTTEPIVHAPSGTKITVQVKDYTATFVPSYSQPSGKNWLFYDDDAKEFRAPQFDVDEYGPILGNDPIDKDDVMDMLKRGVIVYFVDGIPRKFQN